MTARGADFFPGRYVQSPLVAIVQTDKRALMLMRTRGHSAPAERAVSAYSRLGEHGACWLALGGAGALLARDPERRRRWLRGAGIVAAAYCANQSLKLVFRRPRQTR